MRRGVAALLLVVACGGEAEPPPAAAPPSAGPGAPAQPQATQPQAPPPQATPPASPPAPTAPAEEALPTGSLRGDAARGATLYAQYCVSCHGPQGKGDGPLGATLTPRPADHTSAAYMGSLSDAHLYTVIRKGGAAVGKSPLMAPWGGVLTERDTKDLVAHLRRLSGT